MNSLLYISLALAPCAIQPANGQDIFHPNHYASDDVIRRDVAVIGGGSSGTYGAINLRRRGQSVVLVEKAAVLGGHTNTYTDPVSGTAIDYGVQAFWNISVTHDYFAYLGIPTTQYTGDARTDVYADFQTGTRVTVNSSSNYTAYLQQLQKYPWLEYSWDLPDPVPEDLTLPFSGFLKKYDLEDIGYNVYYGAQGLSNVLDQLTVNVFKIFDGSFIDALHGGDVKGAHANGDIYTQAAARLGTDVLYSSQVVAARRPDNGTGVRLVVRTPTGHKLILASRLLVSIPPLLDNMRPFDLKERERDLFSRWKFSAYYTMLVNNTGLPSGYRFRNADASTMANIPPLPAPYQVTESKVPGIFYVWYGSPYPIEEAAVKADVVEVIRRLRSTVNAKTTSVPEFVAFNSHTPFKLVVAAEDLRRGFYRELAALQGYRDTWYTGAAVISHSSAILWNFTEALIPQMIDPK
nr:NAD binding protein [Aspergillus sp.]